MAGQANGPKWSSIIAAICTICGLSTGGLGMALNWHAATPVHDGAATQRDLEKAMELFRHTDTLIDSRLDRIERRQDQILDAVKTMVSPKSP